MKIAMLIGYQKDIDLTKLISKEVANKTAYVQYYDTEGRCLGEHLLEVEYIEEDFSGFFVEDYKHWFEESVEVASIRLATSIGNVDWKLDNCGINTLYNPEHEHKIQPCTLLKLSLRYGYDPEVTVPDFINK